LVFALIENLTPSANLAVFLGLSPAFILKGMKKIKTRSKGKPRGNYHVCHVNKLIIKPLARIIRKQGVEAIKQSTALVEKLEEIDESIAIIARELKRRGDQGNKPVKSNLRIWPFD